MQRFSRIPLLAVIGIIITFLGGCQAASGIRPVAYPPTSRDVWQDRPTGTNKQPAPFFGQAFEKPPLGERVDRKYGSPPPLPEVPAAMEQLRPVQASARIERHVGKRTYQSSLVFSRTTNRAYVNFKDRGQEWLFLRNPVDNRRVSGQLIDHHAHVILDYPPSDLLDVRVSNGWAEVITLGLPLDLFDHMVATGESRSLDGIVFQRYLPKDSPQSKAGTLAEIWWSPECYLPLRIVRTSKHGSWIQELTHIRFDVDRDVLKNPLQRFPGYAVADNADWSGCDHNHAAIHAMGLSH